MLIRLIDEIDTNNLRKWKNDNKGAFFSQKTISLRQQIRWFKAYQKRLNDYMFVVVADGDAVGCMGIRLLDDKWDIYNVIICKEFSGRGLMSQALKEMIDIAILHDDLPITVKVLKNNKAVDWYRKNGFSILREREDSYCMLYRGDDL